MSRLRNWARTLKRQTLIVYYAARDPRTPWLPRLLALAIAAYALSPIDLIPDFVPVLGYVDDVLLLPGLIWLTIRLIPAPVLAECRERADAWMQSAGSRPTSRWGAALVVAVWIAAAAGAWYLWAR